MSNFSCHSETEMESSKVHYSELSYSTDSEWSAENNREHFELLKRDPEYGRFFRDFDTLMLGERISAGAQAEIYEARLQPNSPFDKVVKVMMGDAPLQAFQSQWPVGMLSAHSKFKHLFDLPLITILGGTLLKDARFAFVMYRRWGDLRLLISRRMEHTSSSPFPIEQAIQLMRSIAEDMKTLHEKHDILHRDLKASNVLIWGDFPEDVSLVTTCALSEKIYTIVADFECSVGVLGTGFWRAPEILQQLRERVPASKVEFTRASDVYSYGMTCYEILTGCIPFDGHYNQEMVSKVLLGLRPDLPRDLPEFLRGIILRCWSLDPSQRPNFSEICEMLERRRGPNPVSVSVDEEFHKHATVIKVKQWMNPQPLALLEVIQKLIDMDLCLWKAADSNETSDFCYQEFMVTDREGLKIQYDTEFIEHIRKVLSMPVKIKWITDNLGRSVVPFTCIHLSGRRRHGLLVDVSTILDEMICKVSSAGVWTHKCGVACVIHVKCQINVKYAEMGGLWDRLFLILQGHDNKQVVERFGAQEFLHLERNMLIEYSLPPSPLDASYLHIHLEKTERGNDSLIAHVKCANDPQLLQFCMRKLEDFGYGVHNAMIYHPVQKKILLGRNAIYEDIKGGIQQILWGALQRHSAQVIRLREGCIEQIVEGALKRPSAQVMKLREGHIEEIVKGALEHHLSQVIRLCDGGIEQIMESAVERPSAQVIQLSEAGNQQVVEGALEHHLSQVIQLSEGRNQLIVEGALEHHLSQVIILEVIKLREGCSQQILEGALEHHLSQVIRLRESGIEQIVERASERTSSQVIQLSEGGNQQIVEGALGHHLSQVTQLCEGGNQQIVEGALKHHLSQVVKLSKGAIQQIVKRALEHHLFHVLRLCKGDIQQIVEGAFERHSAHVIQLSEGCIELIVRVALKRHSSQVIQLREGDNEQIVEGALERHLSRLIILEVIRLREGCIQQILEGALEHHLSQVIRLRDCGNKQIVERASERPSPQVIQLSEGGNQQIVEGGLEHHLSQVIQLSEGGNQQIVEGALEHHLSQVIKLSEGPIQQIVKRALKHHLFHVVRLLEGDIQQIVEGALERHSAQVIPLHKGDIQQIVKRALRHHLSQVIQLSEGGNQQIVEGALERHSAQIVEGALGHHLSQIVEGALGHHLSQVYRFVEHFFDNTFVQVIRLSKGGIQQIVEGALKHHLFQVVRHRKGGIQLFVRGALERHSAQVIQLSITGDKMGLIVDLEKCFRKNHISIFKTDVSVAYEDILYVVDAELDPNRLWRHQSGECDLDILCPNIIVLNQADAMENLQPLRLC